MGRLIVGGVPAEQRVEIPRQDPMRDRRKITVQGVVQGVGFRPFVYGLANRLGLDGSVRNDTAGVVIDVEGLGGYHLSCDALRNDVVRELRRRKQREAKPLDVMVQNLDMARRLCAVSTVEAELLTSARSPILLLRKHPDCPIAGEVAPQNRYLSPPLPW